MNQDIDPVNSRASSYNIVTKCEEKNVHIVIGRIINILQNYVITDVDIRGAKINNAVIFENKKFYDIDTFNKDYKTYQLFNKPFMKNKDIYKFINNIRAQEIKDYYNIFRHHILSSCTLFYHSNKNLNDKIDDVLKSTLNKKNYKLLYI